MNKRVTYFDLAKGIGIILVVLGHMENISTELRVWISSFHMPLFFVISGMLLAFKDDMLSDLKLDSVSSIISDSFNVKNQTKKVFKGLMIPYFWFSLIYIPIDIMNLFIDNVDKHTFIQNILDSVSFGGVSVMWFLPALFIAETVSILLISLSNKINGKKQIKYAVLFAMALLISILTYGIWSNIKPYYEINTGNYFLATAFGFIRTILRGMCLSVHVVIGFIFFRLLAYCQKLFVEKKLQSNTAKENKEKVEDAVITMSGSNNEKLTEYINKEFNGFSIAAGVIFYIINMSLCLINGAVDNHFLTLNNLVLYYICAFLGSVSIILICKGIGSISFIEFFGKNSLIVMATHLQCYILYAGILIAIAIDAHITRAKSYVYMFNSVLFTMLFEVIIIFVINRFFPFVVGKKGAKNK